MSIFLLAALPLGALFVVLLPWDGETGAPEAVPRHRLPAGHAVGAARVGGRAAVPPARRRPPDGVPAVPHPARRGGRSCRSSSPSWRSCSRSAGSIFPATEEGILLTALCFLAGFLAVLDLGEFLRSWRTWDAHALFLLPLERFAVALALAMAAHRFYRWEGSLGLLFVGLTAAATPVLASFAFLYHINHVALAWGLVSALFVAVAVVFALRYARVLRG